MSKQFKRDELCMLNQVPKDGTKHLLLSLATMILCMLRTCDSTILLVLCAQCHLQVALMCLKNEGPFVHGLGRD
jgi:hypothetical protein